MRTARFTEVVRTCGRPKVHLAWSKPADDAELQRAAKAGRVLTVHQELRGAKKDYGAVGVQPAHNAQYFLFPRALSAYRERRIVGIDYALLDESVSASAVAVPSARRARAPEPAPRAQTKKIPSTSAHPAKKKGFRAMPDSTARLKRAVPSKPPPPPQREPREQEIARALAEIERGKSEAASRRLKRWLKKFG